MLKKIQFNKDEDHMIIMGDIIDRGPAGIELIEYVKPFLKEGSMELLLGNHEMFAIMYLNGTLRERTWIAFGGKETVESVNEMTEVEKQQLKEFLKSLPYYTEINSEIFGRTIVTHTGIDADNYVFNADGSINITESIEKAVEMNEYNFMVGTDLHNIPVSDKRKFDAYLIVGHTPCYRLNDHMENNFYRTKYYMDIDSGAGHKDNGGVLGCYCVTTDKEIYL